MSLREGGRGLKQVPTIFFFYNNSGNTTQKVQVDPVKFTVVNPLEPFSEQKFFKNKFAVTNFSKTK